MIFCNECGMKAPQHKATCSQVGGAGATPRNTYVEREDTIPDAVVAAAVMTVLAEADSSTDTSTEDSSTSTGE